MQLKVYYNKVYLYCRLMCTYEHLYSPSNNCISVILYLGLVEKQVLFIELTSVNRTSFTKLINVH